MKKVLILALCLLALLGSIYFGTQATNGVRPGMTFDELYERGDFFYKDGHFFYKNWAGNYVIARQYPSYDPKANQVKEVRVYNHKRVFPTHANFARLEEGMSIFEVAALVGIPFRETTSGASSTDYRAADGSIYTIYWATYKTEDGKYDGTNLTLAFARLAEDNRSVARVVYAICGAAVIICVAALLILKKKGILFKKKHVESQ